MYCQLSNKRRVVVAKFQGNMFVNIREFYEDKSGEMKPGKKVRRIRRAGILACSFQNKHPPPPPSAAICTRIYIDLSPASPRD